MSRRTFISALTLLAAASLSQAQEPAAKLPSTTDPQLKTLDDQAAYAIGLDLGADRLATAPDLNPDRVPSVLIDAMRKSKPLLSAEQAQGDMNQFMAKKLGPGAEK